MSTKPPTRSQLIAELQRAHASLRADGAQPTPQDSALLLAVLTSVRDGLVEDGAERTRWVHRFGPLQFEVSSIWAADGRLQRFQLSLMPAGSIVFAGDRYARLLPAKSHRAEREHMDSGVRPVAGGARRHQ